MNLKVCFPCNKDSTVNIRLHMHSHSWPWSGTSIVLYTPPPFSKQFSGSYFLHPINLKILPVGNHNNSSPKNGMKRWVIFSKTYIQSKKV